MPSQPSQLIGSSRVTIATFADTDGTKKNSANTWVVSPVLIAISNKLIANNELQTTKQMHQQKTNSIYLHCFSSHCDTQRKGKFFDRHDLLALKI